MIVCFKQIEAKSVCACVLCTHAFICTYSACLVLVLMWLGLEVYTLTRAYEDKDAYFLNYNDGRMFLVIIAIYPYK